jgi:hypothetical protein
MRITDTIKYCRDIRDMYRTRPILTSGRISYANWWKENVGDSWFTRFLNFYYPKCMTPVRFYSVFGKRDNIRESFDGVKIFYTGENMEPRIHYDENHEWIEKAAVWDRRIRDYQDYAMQEVDLALGFGEHTENQYLRFPFWLLRFTDPEDQVEDIQKKIDAIESPFHQVSSARKDAVLVATHDFLGTRDRICREAGQVLRIEYGGKWRNSSDRLWNEFHDDKNAYLSQFRFNICPENMDAPGYVTEKLFDAFRAGCIPIYHGNRNYPEPQVLNQSSIIFWDYTTGADNAEQVALLRELNEDDVRYREFLSQPVFCDGAAEFIYNTYLMPLRDKLGQLLSQS